ncbi:hypothetical protein KKE45_02410 [Patescibacteria group bacterium]|nr:hypothetical protein [Patescibacteria group bacterium]
MDVIPERSRVIKSSEEKRDKYIQKRHKALECLAGLDEGVLAELELAGGVIPGHVGFFEKDLSDDARARCIAASAVNHLNRVSGLESVIRPDFDGSWVRAGVIEQLYKHFLARVSGGVEAFKTFWAERMGVSKEGLGGAGGPWGVYELAFPLDKDIETKDDIKMGDAVQKLIIGLSERFLINQVRVYENDFPDAGEKIGWMKHQVRLRDQNEPTDFGVCLRLDKKTGKEKVIHLGRFEQQVIRACHQQDLGMWDVSLLDIVTQQLSADDLEILLTGNSDDVGEVVAKYGLPKVGLDEERMPFLTIRAEQSGETGQREKIWNNMVVNGGFAGIVLQQGEGLGRCEDVRF